MLLRRVQPNSLYMGFISLDDLDLPPARMFDDRTLGWDTFCQHECKPTKRIDRFFDFSETGIDHSRNVVELCPRVAVPHAFADIRNEDFGCIIVLVFDLADNFLDQTLKCDKAVRAAIFIDHQSKVHS